ncbi:hypothetical protein Tco_0884021 [Tanacetum coccineum]
MRMPYIEADSMTHPDLEMSKYHICDCDDLIDPVLLQILKVLAMEEMSGVICQPVTQACSVMLACSQKQVFDRFRNMRASYIEADCMTQPAICKRSLSTMAELYPTVFVANHQSSKAKMLSSASDCLI